MGNINVRRYRAGFIGGRLSFGVVRYERRIFRFLTGTHAPILNSQSPAWGGEGLRKDTRPGPQFTPELR